MNIKYGIRKIKIIFFDGDNTLWKTLPGEFISRIPSKLKLINNHIIIRSADGVKFILDRKLPSCLKSLREKGILIGLISDNREEMVWRALKLFKIDRYFNKKYVNIRFFEGPAPKIKMISEVLKGLKRKKIKIQPKEVLFIDDKDYSQEAYKFGVSFIQLREDDNIVNLLQSILKS